MNNRDFTKHTIEAAIRLGLLMMLTYWCFIIVRPFIVTLLWAVIIAVAVFPLFNKLKALLGGRNKLASTMYTLVALAILITPTVLVSNSILDTANILTERHAAGTLEIPPPAESVRDWPLIGEKSYALWADLSAHLDATLKRYKTEITELARSLLGAVRGLAGR